MRIAIISDIHGNSVALEAVLSDLQTEHIDRVVCLGDIATDGPQPREALEMKPTEKIRISFTDPEKVIQFMPVDNLRRKTLLMPMRMKDD